MPATRFASPTGRLISVLSLTGIVTLATYFTFNESRRNEFVQWDDDVYVVNNPHITVLNEKSIVWIFTHSYYHSYTPLTILSHAIDRALWGNEASGHHLTSIIIHSVNAGWIFLLALFLFRATGREYDTSSRPSKILEGVTPAMASGAVVSALLWSLHPLRVESVAWVSDRKDVLCAAFLLPCYIAYVLFSTAPPGKRHRWYLLSVVLFLPAVLSKTFAITAPLVMLLLDVFCFRPGSWWEDRRTLLREKAPFIAISLLIGLAATLSAETGRVNTVIAELSLWQRILVPFYALSFYLAKTIWPLHLAAVYDFPSSGFMIVHAVMIILISAFAAVMAWLGSRVLLAGWVGYLLLVAPTLGLLFSGIQPIADRYSYFPSLSIALLIGALVTSLLSSPGHSLARVFVKGAILIASVLLCLQLAFLARAQVRIWHDSKTLWTRALEISPGAAAPYNGLGLALLTELQADDAIRFYREALRIQPFYAPAWINLGVACIQKRDTAEAIRSFLQAVQVWPDGAAPRLNLGHIALAQGHREEAFRLFRRSYLLDPSSPQVLRALGDSYFEVGICDSALFYLDRLSTLLPNDAEVKYKIGMVHRKLENEAGAKEAFRQSASLGSIEAGKVLQEIDTLR